MDFHSHRLLPKDEQFKEPKALIFVSFAWLLQLELMAYFVVLNGEDNENKRYSNNSFTQPSHTRMWGSHLHVMS